MFMSITLIAGDQGTLLLSKHECSADSLSYNESLEHLVRDRRGRISQPDVARSSSSSSVSITR
ncbi:uncharacterized protein FOMMEDRAFT_21221 [Fomitiporia mediterranea MF3/22]|uniref:uncharacterized protein n=1 Tax=Fomitiporia mediterranea (strain MF3/22) TaxID=694068 RepID=UPI00044084EF|nr:uncharacterized protein FOMMEDRAFT_21221 [Fomitiporia mediterranea MF3/22]EJD02518.1 hypothetical protein FOMMEDRAFT_21221 [Fomitiporia mediterranea MF3/22]